jgi:hypothetical protein
VRVRLVNEDQYLELPAVKSNNPSQVVEFPWTPAETIICNSADYGQAEKESIHTYAVHICTAGLVIAKAKNFFCYMLFHLFPTIVLKPEINSVKFADNLNEFFQHIDDFIQVNPGEQITLEKLIVGGVPNNTYSKNSMEKILDQLHSRQEQTIQNALTNNSQLDISSHQLWGQKVADGSNDVPRMALHYDPAQDLASIKCNHGNTVLSQKEIATSFEENNISFCEDH